MKSNEEFFSDLAIHGGQPVRTKPWPTYDKGDVILDDDDVSMVYEVIKSKRLFRYDNRELHDTKVGQFENELKQFFKVEYALAVSSGTAAISLPLMALELPDDSLVGCPTYSFTATPSAIIQAKLKPLLIEVDHNLHMDLIDLENKIKSLKALVVVHMRGFPAPLHQIKEIADKHGVPIIEDAVPALGHKIRGDYIGTLGVAGAFSTQSDKSINTGEGGFILTNDKNIFMKCVILSGAYESLYKKHFFQQEHLDVTSLPVFNFRLDEIHGALGLSQLKKLNRRLAVLSENYAYLTEQIKDLKNVRPRGAWSDEIVPIGDSILLAVNGTIEDRCWFAEALTKEGVDARALGNPKEVNVRRFWNWAYLSEDKVQNNLTSVYPVSFKHISTYIDIPLSPTLLKKDLDDCTNAIKKVCDYYETKI